jgi:hypothetical protein
MNDWTLRQWNAYVERSVSCPDCAWLLRAMVREHDAGKGVAHPGHQRLQMLCGRSWSWVKRHLGELADDGHIVLVTRYSFAAHKADEYAIPWLTNDPRGIADPRHGQARSHRGSAAVSAPRKRGSERGGERGTSFSFFQKEKNAHDDAAPRHGVGVVRDENAVGGTNGDESVQPCPDCEGVGYIEVTDQSGRREGMAPCPTCHPARRKITP